MQRSILGPLLDAAGARRDPARDDVVTGFGDPAAELAALGEDCALLDETDRGAVRCAGADALDFLHRVLANDVKGLAVGEERRNLLLTPKGRVRHLVELVRLAEQEALLLTAPGEGAPLAEALEADHFAEALELADDTARHAPLALLGPRAGERLASLLIGGELPAEGRATTLDHGGRPTLVVHARRHGAPGYLLDAGPDGAEALWRALRDAGARPVGAHARDALRIAAGEALAGVDVDEQSYPQEARLADAFSLSKGCYPGQEVVAKIDTYGGLNRRVVVLELDSAGALERDAPLSVQDGGERKSVGRVTSWAPRPGGGALALGTVKLAHEAPGTRLLVGEDGLEARVVAPR